MIHDCRRRGYSHDVAVPAMACGERLWREIRPGLPVSFEPVLRRLSAVVTTTARLPETCPEFIAIGDDGAIIGVRRVESPSRQRFSIAHAIGHLVLHKGTGLSQSGDESIRRLLETEANAFAAGFLMPTEAFLCVVKSVLGRLPDAPWDVDALRRLDARFALLKRLAKKFNVSRQAAFYRLSDLGLFDCPDDFRWSSWIDPLRRTAALGAVPVAAPDCQDEEPLPF